MSCTFALIRTRSHFVRTSFADMDLSRQAHAGTDRFEHILLASYSL